VGFELFSRLPTLNIRITHSFISQLLSLITGALHKSDKTMAQNVYDNDVFFKAYVGLKRSVGGLDIQIEWPWMRDAVGDFKGKDVLDLGSGMGFFCRFARENGAKTVKGIDLSENMLALARSREEEAGAGDSSIHYTAGDLETIELPAASYDIVYSSLALHYIASLPRLIIEIAKALRPGGRFACSLEHPILTAPPNPDWVPHKDHPKPIWPLENYFVEGPRQVPWLIEENVLKQHRTTETYVNLLLGSGLRLIGFKECGVPIDRPDIEYSPRMWHRPYYLLLSAEKPLSRQA
jgi:SAM-dependent methyltransferase